MNKEELKLNKKEKSWIAFGIILFIYFCIAVILTKNTAWISVAFMWLLLSVTEYLNVKTVKIKDLMIQKQDEFIQKLIKNKQQELDKQNLIEKLEEANKRDKHTVQTYENMYRNATEEFYKRSYKRTIDMANARRETRKGILDLLKER